VATENGESELINGTGLEGEEFPPPPDPQPGMRIIRKIERIASDAWGKTRDLCIEFPLNAIFPDSSLKVENGTIVRFQRLF
jgi:hypothetical protein